MSMSRCDHCNEPIDTDDCPECYRGKDGDVLLCDPCAEDAYLCSKCEKVCDVIEVEDTEVSEAWGAREVQRVTFLVSECCGKDVVTVTEGL